MLRDEGEAYVRQLIEAGVNVTALCCLGITHDFVMRNALAETPVTSHWLMARLSKICYEQST